MTVNEMIKILRDPYDRITAEVRQAQIEAADILEKVEASKLDLTCNRPGGCTCLTLAQKSICAHCPGYHWIT